MTVYYSNADLRYVESQRAKREEEAAEKDVQLVRSEDGVYRSMRLGKTKGLLGK